MSSRPPTKDARELEAGLPTAHQEKLGLGTAATSFAKSQEQPQRRMSSPRRVLLALAVCLLVWLGMTTAAPSRREACLHHNAAQAHSGGNGDQVQLSAGDAANPTQPESAFACLLNAVSPEALHDVLHRYFPDRFKDGVYETDHSAMEAVHREDPPLATSLIHIAKRQAGGSNATSPTTSSTTSAPSPPPQTTSTTTTPLSPPPSTTTTTTSPTASPSAPPSSSTSADKPPSSTPPDKTSPTATKTNSPPSLSSSRSQRPQTTTFRSTASNGEVTVITATTFVNVDPAQPTGTQADGSLQTNAAVARGRNLGVEAAAGLFLGGLLLV